jgi:hypothetical protein
LLAARLSLDEGIGTFENASTPVLRRGGCGVVWELVPSPLAFRSGQTWAEACSRLSRWSKTDLLENLENALSRSRSIESHPLKHPSPKSRGLKRNLLTNCLTVDYQAAVAVGRLSVTSISTSWSSASSSLSHLLHRLSSSSQPVPPDAALPAVRCMPSPRRRTGASSMATSAASIRSMEQGTKA